MRRRASALLQVPESVTRLAVAGHLENGDGSAAHAHNGKMMSVYAASASVETFTPDVPGAYIVKANADGTLVVLSAPEGSRYRKPERPWHARYVEPTG